MYFETKLMHLQILSAIIYKWDKDKVLTFIEYYSRHFSSCLHKRHAKILSVYLLITNLLCFRRYMNVKVFQSVKTDMTELYEQKTGSI